METDSRTIIKIKMYDYWMMNVHFSGFCNTEPQTEWGIKKGGLAKETPEALPRRNLPILDHGGAIPTN